MIFTIGPAIYAIYLASLANFRALLRDPLTWNSLVTKRRLRVVRPDIHCARARRGPGRASIQAAGEPPYRAAFLLPYVSSVVAVALLWQAIYRAGSLGLGRPDWLSNPNTALLRVDAVSIWAHVGGQMLVLLGASMRFRKRTSMRRSSMERARGAASGASRLPLLRPVTWFVFLTGVISALQMFTLVFVLTQGGPFPLHAPDVVVHRIYRTAFGPQALGHGERAGPDARRGPAWSSGGRSSSCYAGRREDMRRLLLGAAASPWSLPSSI